MRIGRATSLLETFDICPGLGVVLLKELSHSAVMIGQKIVRIEGKRLRAVSNGALIVALIRIGAPTVNVGGHIARVEGQSLREVSDGTARVPLP